MSLVRSAEEITAMQECMSNPQFLDATMLQVDFLSTPATVRRVLPPGLEPLEQPTMTAAVGHWRSNCVGDFSGGAIYVSCRHGEIVGSYTLAMYMSSDSSVTFGRDVFGEPKKIALAGLETDGTRAHGWIDRFGERLVEIDAELTEEIGPVRGQRSRFNVKAVLAADGIGLQGDATLTVSDFELDLPVNRAGVGTLRLGGNAHDSLHELEILKTLRAGYAEGDLSARCRALATIPADAFLPFALGRLDYWPALATSTRGEWPRA
jgi:acetoacetate decarboxylase